MDLNQTQPYDIAVVGGGIAGLTAAAFLARAGRSVILFEQANSPGGRAVTQNVDDFLFNLGPHALYRGGHAMRVLSELGITIDEGKVGTTGSTGVRNGRVHRLPVGALSLFSSSLFSWSGRLEMMRILAGIPRLNPASVADVPLKNWLDTRVHDPVVRQFMEALVRVSTYANDPDQISAGAAIEQLQKAFQSSVSYLNGGWQTLVDRLHSVATTAGTEIHTSARVQSIVHDSGEAKGVKLTDGSSILAKAVVMATPPAAVHAMLGAAAGFDLIRWMDRAVPVQAACLDLGLRRLPKPHTTFALGIDQPIYLSVHSRWARLAPDGFAVLHVAKYLPCGIATDASADQREVETFLDLVQPGWRDEVMHSRFLPRMTVTHASVRVGNHGLQGRPSVKGTNLRNVYLAGDWVGPEGMLADASFASAQRTAQLIVQGERPMLQAKAV